MNTFAGTTSVGTITDADLKTLAVYAENPQWPFKAFAKHAVASSLRSISTISFARTWRITSTFEPTAGGEGCVTLHCGQPLRNPAALLVFAMPLRRQGKNSPDEQLEKAIMLQPMAKGASKALRYGPVCRSGAHIVCVSLNGAHVVGSPMHVTVAPGAPEPTRCELVPSPSTTYGTAGAARGEATREIVVWLQLRDRYGNRCTREAAIEVVEHGDLAVSVTRITNVDGTHPEQQLGYPSALSPAAGSDAAKGLVTWTVRVVEESDGCAPGSSSRSEGSEKVPRGFREGSEKVPRSVGSESGEGGVSTRGVVCLVLNVAHAGVHSVSARLEGLPLANALPLTVLPGPAKATASTAHDAVEGETTSCSRCIAGVSRRLRLVARDARGNAAPIPALAKWAAFMRSSAGDEIRSASGRNPESL
jgi:hypothetical protein